MKDSFEAITQDANYLQSEDTAGEQSHTFTGKYFNPAS